MHEIISFVGGLAAAYGGLALLALAMARHWRQAMGTQIGKREAPRPRAALTLRACGVALIVASLALMIHGNGPGFGALLWLLCVSVGGYSVVATFAFQPTWFRPIACLC